MAGRGGAGAEAAVTVNDGHCHRRGCVYYYCGPDDDTAYSRLLTVDIIGAAMTRGNSVLSRNCDRMGSRGVLRNVQNAQPASLFLPVKRLLPQLELKIDILLTRDPNF